MSAVLAGEFLSEYPRFEQQGVTPAEVQRILDRCERLYCPADRWLSDQVDGIMLRTAHILDKGYLQAAAIAAAAGNAAAGEAAPSMPVGSGDDADLMTTPYGTEFMALRDALVTTTGFSF